MVDGDDMPEVGEEWFKRARLKMPSGQMCVTNTPLEHHPDLGLWVKREDLSCPDGPHFSKTRGVWRHVSARNEEVIGVLDTAHSQGGWAVAQACNRLGRRCILFYPVRKSEQGAVLKPQQRRAQALGAVMMPLPAGPSWYLYHQAKKAIADRGGYMMPNALKLQESVEETAAELLRTELPTVHSVLVSASSGTLAAGVLRGLHEKGWGGQLAIHMGYSRPPGSVLNYIGKIAGLQNIGAPADTLRQFGNITVQLYDEGYSYADSARPGVDPPFPCNEYYDLKALRFWQKSGGGREALFWNIG